MGNSVNNLLLLVEVVKFCFGDVLSLMGGMWLLTGLLYLVLLLVNMFIVLDGLSVFNVKMLKLVLTNEFGSIF